MVFSGVANDVCVRHISYYLSYMFVYRFIYSCATPVEDLVGGICGRHIFFCYFKRFEVIMYH